MTFYLQKTEITQKVQLDDAAQNAAPLPISDLLMQVTISDDKDTMMIIGTHQDSHHLNICLGYDSLGSTCYTQNTFDFILSNAFELLNFRAGPQTIIDFGIPASQVPESFSTRQFLKNIGTMLNAFDRKGVQTEYYRPPGKFL